MEKAPKFRKDQPYGSIHPVQDDCAFEQNGWFYDAQHQPVRKSDTPPPPKRAAVVEDDADDEIVEYASVDEIPDESSDDVPVSGTTMDAPDKSALAQWYRGAKMPWFSVRKAVKNVTGQDVSSTEQARALLAEKFGW